MEAQMNDQQQKDFMAGLFSQSQMDMTENVGAEASFQSGYAYNPHPSPAPESSGQLQGNMQYIPSHNMSSTTEQLGINPNVIEHHIRLQQLQQLQQLQKQIFEQQMALINGGPPASSGSGNEALLQSTQESPYTTGLLTPGSSTELRPERPPTDFVSPMFLSYVDHPHEDHRYVSSIPPSPQYQSPQINRHPGSMSAPADIAFRRSNNHASDIELDMSPLTSPWLGAHNPGAAARNGTKRTASPSAEEERQARKRKNAAGQSKIVPSLARRASRISQSANSTPLFPAAPQDNGISDSPSPVDLSMTTSVVADSGSDMQNFSQNSMNPITPVTPAMIMNLGRMAGSGSSSNTRGEKTSSNGQSRRAETSVRPKPVKKVPANTTPKAILPAAAAPTGFTYNEPSTGPVKKTSHKAAEQKRRDSMKTTFDDLRNLLPPIPLPTDADKYEGDELPLLPIRPTLPGALPPRGPPKSGEGPNKGVSKLQLLMCGNEFIRVLRGRVERRDEEINELRTEVDRLRARVSMEDAEISRGKVDLDRDIDDVESRNDPRSSGGMLAECDEDEEED